MPMNNRNLPFPKAALITVSFVSLSAKRARPIR